MKNVLLMVAISLVLVACQGPKGEAGLVGAAGPQGEQGNQGIPGQTPVPRQDVNGIDLCPGYTPIYPAVFPEYALCINNDLYAVYWDGHNSWLTKLLPGAYASTSTSAACNFTITEGCNVTH